MKRVARGFSLIEVMVVVAIVGILTAVALPAYRDYVLRARLGEAFTALGGVQLTAEQYWNNNRTYATNGANSMAIPATTANFSYALTAATASAYTVKATGLGSAAGFGYTIDQNGSRVTTDVPSGYTANATCWVDRKGGQCTQ